MNPAPKGHFVAKALSDIGEEKKKKRSCLLELFVVKTLLLMSE